MESRTEKTNFNMYFPWMWGEAQRIQLNKGEWFKKANIHQNRWVEFARAAKIRHGEEGQKVRDLSAKYFIRLAEGINLTPDQIADKSGIKFTPDQIEEFREDAWIRNNKELIRKLMKQDESYIENLSSIIPD
jgi:hypothetical protein